MGLVGLLFLIFIISVIVILMTSPDRMGEEESFKAEVKDLWGIVKLCNTASYGSPTLELKPAKRSVTMGIDFINADTVSINLPLLLKKQQKSKAEYLKLFSDHNLKFAELDNKIIVHIDRKDENVGQFIAKLYKDIFEASDADSVKFKIKTLKSDIKFWRHAFIDGVVKFNPDAEFIAHSAKYEGKSVRRVISERVFGAAYFLLYPPLIILSYKFGDITWMCWSALLFFGFFSVYNPVYKKHSVFESVVSGSILYCVLMSATLLTQKTIYLQAIPSVIGISIAVMSAALVLGIRKPKSKNDIMQKQKNRREFIFMKSFLVFGGLGLFLVSEWARRSFTFDSWVSFFAYMRIELIFAMLVVFIPAMAIFLHTEKKRT